MTTEPIDEMFIVIHSLTLCIEVEITTTEHFLKTEIEYSKINGYQTQIKFLTRFSEIFDKVISKPFYEKVFIPNMEEKMDADTMDFLFSYSYLKNFFKEFHKANILLTKHFKDAYTLSEVNNDIRNAYPGIGHNPELFPHQELIQYLGSMGKGK